MLSLRNRQAIFHINIWLLIFSGFALSAAGFTVVRNWDRQKRQADFELAAENHFNAVKREIESDLEVLASLRAFFLHAPVITRSEFRNFVQPLLLKHPGIQALEWIPRISNTRCEEYEKAARRDGFEDFRITEKSEQGKLTRASRRDEYFPVYYVEPYEGNECALGYDLSSDPLRKAALERARDTGMAAATARITLVQEQADRFGFLIFSPLYKKNGRTDSRQARCAALRGFALGVFRIGDIVERALTYLKPAGIDIYIYDNSVPGEESFLYYHPSCTGDRAETLSNKSLAADDDLKITRTLPIGGRAWSLLFVPAPGYFAYRKTWHPWGVLSAGLLLTGLFAAFVIAEGKYAGALSSSNELLRQEIGNRKQMEEELQLSAEKIYRLAYYDNLTGFANRTFFQELLLRAIEHAKRHQEAFALIYIGLDNFQRLNDTLGHNTGDLLLKAVADRLLNSLRKSDYVAASYNVETVNVLSRVGGDEFVVLAQDIAEPQEAAVVSHRLLVEISKPYDLNGREAFMTASIGIALYPDDGANVDELMKNADAALEQVKKEGKNNYQFYSRGMNASGLESLLLENDLHKALERNELELYYQPKVDVATGMVSGMEALIRWHHPDKGLIAPMQFIPLAETNGLIVPIGEFVVHAACRQIKAWQEAGYNQLNVTVNVSGRQFDQEGLTEVVTGALRAAMLSPQCLTLEITESTIMRNPEQAIQTLRKIKALGLQIAIDDFGTGYSSLNFLKRLPLDFLKIDQSFVRNLASDRGDQAIVRATIVMAHSLNLKTVAEGVETEEQLSFLREHGCDEIQGYLFSKPLPAEEIPGTLAKRYL